MFTLWIWKAKNDAKKKTIAPITHLKEIDKKYKDHALEYIMDDLLLIKTLQHAMELVQTVRKFSSSAKNDYGIMIKSNGPSTEP